MTKNCFTQQINELCPFCKSPENVFLGHGTVRHCLTCVLSWGEDEIFDVQFAEPLPANNKIVSVDSKKRKNTTMKGLRQASDLPARLQRLRSIPQETWDSARETDEQEVF